jgi:prepilin-type N-terminal cleavage/methylation domain-containing protein
MKNLTKKGFTLIELLIVIAIITILSAIVFAALSEARAKGRDTARIVALKEVQKALSLYYSNEGSYPVQEGWIDTLVTGKYIAAVSSDIVYRPVKTENGDDYGGQRCFLPNVCKSYLIGIKLETKNVVLNSDKDFYINTHTSVFNGLSAEACEGVIATSTPDQDRCYDLTSF